ncbi:MAG: hypothetical protein QM760_19165 [Nibricoccus sp.]
MLYAFALRTHVMKRWLDDAAELRRTRWLGASSWILAAVLAAFALNSDQIPAFANNYHRELAKNGLWSFFAAFRNNELDYDQFYATRDIDHSFNNIRPELSADGAQPLGSNPRDTLRFVRNRRPGDSPQRHSDNRRKPQRRLPQHASTALHSLTPNLEALADKSLVFDQFLRHRYSH